MPVDNRSLQAARSFRTKLIIVLAITLALYAVSLRNGFVWDDWDLVVQNDAYRQADLHSILFGKANALEYLPVRDLSLTLDTLLWGGRPLGFHATNLLLYLGSIAAFAFAVRRIALMVGERNAEDLALWSTLIFALHPIHAEAVNWVTSRNTLLASLFLFLSLLSLLKWTDAWSRKFLILSLLSYLLACFSKAIVVFFPVIVAVLLWGIFPPTLARGRRAKTFLLFVLTAVGASVVHLVNASASGIMNADLMRIGAANPLWSLARAVQVPWFYLLKLIVPYPLSVQYDVSFTRGAVLVRACLAGAALAAAAGAAWSVRRTRPMLMFGIFWFLASLVPVMNLFPTHPVVADRYVYLAVAGFAIAAASTVTASARHRKPLAAGLAAAIVLWSAVTVSRTLDWRNDLTLWRSALAAAPDGPRTNLAEALWRAGNAEDALLELRKEYDRTGTYQYSYYQGLLLERTGTDAEAVQAFQRALLEGGDTDREVQLSLAKAYERLGNDRSALEHYVRSLEAESVDPNGRREQEARTGTERMQHRFAAQLQALKDAAAQAPEDPASWTQLAVMLHMLGRYKEAEEIYRKALSLDPGSWQLWYNLGLVLKKERRWKDAVASFDRSLAVLPEYADALNNKALCQIRLGRYGEAEQSFLSSLAHRPDFYYAAFNLARLYLAQGRVEQARAFFLRTRSLAAGNGAVESRVAAYLALIDGNGRAIRAGGEQ